MHEAIRKLLTGHRCRVYMLLDTHAPRVVYGRTGDRISSVGRFSLPQFFLRVRPARFPSLRTSKVPVTTLRLVEG